MLIAVGCLALTVSGATDPSEGMTFTKNEKYVISDAITDEILTFEAEIYVPDVGSKRAGTVVGNYYDGGDFSGNRLNIEIREEGCPQLYTASTANSLRSSVSIYDYCKDGEYVHLAVSVERIADGKDKIRYYYNGVLVDTVEYELSDGVLGSTCKHVVGGDNRIKDGFNNRYYQGKIKNIALFTDVRTAEEIAADAAASDSAVVSSSDNLAVCYDLTSAKMYEDLSANNNDLAMETDVGLTFSKNVTPSKLGKNPVNPHTIEATVYLPTHITGRGGVIVGNYDGGTTNKGQFSFEIYNGGAVRLYYNDTTGKTRSMVFSSATSILTGTWVHIAVVHLGNELQCYINGEYVESITSNVYDYQYSTPTQPLCIGGDNRNNNSSAFGGRIKNITMYSDARTAAEVKSDYENGAALTDKGLIAHYDLSAAESEEIVKDKSGHGYDFSKTWLANSGLDLSPYTYSFAVIGDTQKLNYYDVTNGLTGSGSKMAGVYDWIVANKDAKNIKYVMGLGDITDKDMDEEWVHALNQLSKLETAGIPYSLVRGNHESVAQYNKYVTNGVLKYTDTVQGCYREGDYTNTYTKFTVGETDYMVFVLNYGAEDAVLDWAGELIKANPDHRVIITTHCYLFRDGTTLDKGDVCPPDSTGNKAANNGDEMWDKLIRKHPNIFLVLSGHDPNANIVMTQTKGDNGNTVTQFLVDPQGMDAKYDYNTGMVALLHFTEDGRNVAVEYVSGVTGQYFMAVNQFEFELYNREDIGIIRTDFISRDGNVDTYRIYYTNGTYSEYKIYNGLDGAKGEDGKDGKDGVDGKTPYIGSNGNWWIGVIDTGVRADGSAPEPDYGTRIVGGKCGVSAKWYVTDKNVLVIYGGGAVDGYSVGKAPWADYADSVKSVVIKNDITAIGKNAFYGFTALDSVSLPASLLVVGEYAFYGCTSLKSVIIPVNVRVIGAYAFRRSGITALVLRDPAAWSMKGLNETPDNLNLHGVAAAYARVEYYAYEWYVADYVESEGIIASGLCGEGIVWTVSADGTLTLSGDGEMGDFTAGTAPWAAYLPSIFRIEMKGEITNIGKCAFMNADRLVFVTIPETVTKIGAYAFYGASDLEAVNIPASVKSIGKMAFAKCSLSAVYFGNADGWTADGAAILASELLNPETAAQCVALNAKAEWKLDEETAE